MRMYYELQQKLHCLTIRGEKARGSQTNCNAAACGLITNSPSPPGAPPGEETRTNLLLINQSQPSMDLYSLCPNSLVGTDINR